MRCDFFAYMSRMRLINRWGLMRNTQPENDLEHSMQVSMIAHALALLANRRHGARVNPGRVMELAAYHDASEVVTGDLATPIKYFNADIRRAYKQIERGAAEKLLRTLPDDLRADYAPLLLPDEDSREWKIVKAADKLSAYLKCVEELKAGNAEFANARESIGQALKELERDLPELSDFMRECVPSFDLTVDELG